MRQISTILIFGLLLLTRCAPLSAPSEPQTFVVTPALTNTPATPAIASTETVRLLPSTMTPMPTITSPAMTPKRVPGARSNDVSYAPSISADGRYVAFESLATNLVPGDTNRVSDIFVYDRQDSITERVSVTASDGNEANGANSQPSISADGRWVVFTSEARNLASDNANRVSDIFVYDRKTGATKRISVASDGAQSNGASYAPSISADGRYVAYVSTASNLVPDDTNRQPDVFVHDRQTKQTERASVSDGGRQTDGWSDWPSISADGRFIAFGSSATSLTPEATDGIFVRDRQRGTTEWLGAGFAPTISDNGRWVAFLARDEPDDWIILFLYDRQTDTLVRIHRIVEGIQGKPGKEVSISGDGRWVAFWAVASDPTTKALKKHTDVFVYDRQSGTTNLVSVASDGTPGNSGTGSPSISADGRWVAFESSANNLTIDDSNRFTDVFVRDRVTGKTERVSLASSKLE
jgi:Tol biopolymer transport system component